MDIEEIRKDFQIIEKGHIYFDNAATSLTPVQVIEKEMEYYNLFNANIHRGVHKLTQKASEEYEEARKTIAKFLGCKPEQFIFTKNATESLNMVANIVKTGFKVVVTDIEHHSNFLPWLRLKEKGIIDLDFIHVNKDGSVSMKQVEEVCKGANLISVTYCSNVLGNIIPIKEISKIAKENNALLSVDGAQAVPHIKIDAKKIGCDFLSFSGHKMLGPTGTGGLFVKDPDILEPLMLGGGTIKDVLLNTYVLAESPDRFEAGTPNLAGCVGLGRAVEYLEDAELRNIERHEKELVKIIFDELLEDPNFLYFGPENIKEKTGIVSFNIKGIDAHDIAMLLDNKNIMIRSGYHCCLPLMKKFNISGTARASFYLYNTEEEVKRFVELIKETIRTFS